MAQALGLFNDHFLRQLALFLAARRLFAERDLQGIVVIAGTLPVVLLSGLAGDLCERYSKSFLLRRIKEAEIVVMLIGLGALATGHWTLMVSTLILIGCKAALFGPTKYAAIPELVPVARLGLANGWVAMTTFLALLVGQAAAGPVLDIFPTRLAVPALGCLLIALAGTLAAYRVPTLPAQQPNLRLLRWRGIPSPLGQLGGTLVRVRGNRQITTLLLLSFLFWLNAGVLHQTITAFGGPRYLRLAGDQTHLISVLQVTLAVAIMLGSLLAGRLSTWLAPRTLACFGALMMVMAQSTLAVGFGWAALYGALLVTLSVLGLAGALVLIPLQTLLQSTPPAGERGRVLALNSLLGALALLTSGVTYHIVVLPQVSFPAVWLTVLTAGTLLAVTLLGRRRAFDPSTQAAADA